MKKLAVLLLLCSILLSGCELTKGTPLESLMEKISSKFSGIIKLVQGPGPENNVEEFAKAVVTRDFKKAITFYSETADPKMDAQQMERFFYDEYDKYKLEKVNIEKNNATVQLSLMKADVFTNNLLVFLNKEKRTWKIDKIEGDPEYQID